MYVFVYIIGYSLQEPKGQIQQQDEHSCGLAILMVGMFLMLVIPECYIT